MEATEASRWNYEMLGLMVRLTGCTPQEALAALMWWGGGKRV
jgi:hypothetical protein